ncbi:ABC transporter substrate-binding protein [Burkholderia multivorans]|uniref:ABC transporter substrate-binding protein n=1 Tax=Burkholderia multivorans TaxID=87883 RepID=UPI002018FF9D|nr:ABC transporter substrate-binding protein [Burkholderia multivorans]MCO1381800.1 ABC transporter substrate-binding protein [Burkholderia multivorans]MCO1401940.1 ABC transporter substrate-binding protein [Burkholderia multivorans]UQO76353.1 ABC transporter substrate-binding protein [Burkholderia multivorans]
MRRRDLLAGLLLTSAMNGRVSAQAQQPGKVYRIAIVHPSRPVSEMSETGFRFYRQLFTELRQRGYVEGENLIVERYSGAGQAQPFADMVEAVVRSNPDLIFSLGGRLTRAFKAATTTIPIIGYTEDPVATGLVSSLAHPGGNITGVSNDPGPEVWAKRLAFLQEAIPTISRIAFLFEPTRVLSAQGRVVRDAAQQAGISIVHIFRENPVTEAEYRRFFAVMQQEHVDAIVVADSGENITYRHLVVELANAAKLPAIYPYRDFVDVGGLMAYAVDQSDLSRQVAVQIDKILKGTKPGEIPFYLATKFDLLINLKTASSLGLEIPPSLIARADEVIE